MLTAFFIVQLSGIQASEAEDWFSLSTSGNFIPETDIDNTEAAVAYSQFEVGLSAHFLELGYTLTSFSWNKADTLSFGDGTVTPWEQLHAFSAATMQQDVINEKWAYLLLGEGSASFEEKIEESFLEAALLSGLRYTVSEKWALLFGGGIQYNDFELTPFPAGGVQWDVGRGFSLRKEMKRTLDNMGGIAARCGDEKNRILPMDKTFSLTKCCTRL